MFCFNKHRFGSPNQKGDFALLIITHTLRKGISSAGITHLLRSQAQRCSVVKHWDSPGYFGFLHMKPISSPMRTTLQATKPSHLPSLSLPYKNGVEWVYKEEESVTSRWRHGKLSEGLPAVVNNDQIRHNGAVLFALGWISVSYARNQNIHKKF